MKRTLNYTDRKKINSQNISIRLIRENNKIVAFVVETLDLTNLNLPLDSEIYVEAYYRTELRRFSFGTVGNFVNPSPCDLRGMVYPENIKFRVIVVDPSDHVILAQADRITPEELTGRKPIIAVEFSDELGNEVWRVEYEGDDGAPILMINRKIPNIENIARQDPQFLLYVYPAVMREILTHMIFVDRVDSIEEPLTDWHRDWLTFVQQLGVEFPDTLDKEDNNFDKKDVLQWIAECVSKFCSKYNRKFEEYIQRLEEIS